MIPGRWSFDEERAAMPAWRLALVYFWAVAIVVGIITIVILM